MGRLFIDDTRRFPFFFNGYFDICSDKNKGFAFARLKCQINLMGCNRRPAAGYGIGELAFFNSGRILIAAVWTKKGIPVCLEGGYRCVDRKQSVVIPTFPVFCFVIKNGTFYFHLSGAEVTLEILHIIIRIPETPFQIRKQLNRFLPLRIIGKRKLIDLAGILKRYEGEQGGLQMVFLPGKAAVSHSMPAFIKIQRGLGRLPAGIPDAVSFFEIEISAIGIRRDVVVAIAGQTEKLCIFIERVAAAGVGNKTEKIAAAKIVDPGKRRCRICDDIFPVDIIKVTVFHKTLHSTDAFVPKKLCADPLLK